MNADHRLLLRPKLDEEVFSLIFSIFTVDTQAENSL